MERLKQRLVVARQALATLFELKDEPYSKLVRDASIQRFEYTFEAVWKAAHQYLNDYEGMELGSPKGVLRACFQVGLLSEEQAKQALAMTDDRNLTSHTYNERVAAQIFGKIADYENLMDVLLSAIEKKTS